MTNLWNETEEPKTVTPDDSTYPALLRLIKDPPKILYYIGDLSLCETLCLAIVGARHCTPYGRWAAQRIAEKATEYGVTVVSGLAAGIDAAAHKGALGQNGKTIAVLGCGIDLCYPKSNAELYRTIARKGLLLSEYMPGAAPLPFQFPQRNRIISGLSRVVVVAEAGLSSGSLITAERAIEQGREVLAVPGNINCINAIGTNKLIQDGAQPLIVLDDIADALGIPRHSSKERDSSTLSQDERQLIAWIESQGEVTSDLLARNTGRTANEIAALLTILEMKGWIQTSMGKIFIAKG